MTGSLASNPTRWRTFADAVATALGLNVWVSVILLPGIFVGVWTTPSSLAAACLPVAVLSVGLFRRSDAILLLGFPSALLVPAAFYSEIIAHHVYGPIRFVIVAISVIAYLFGASFLSSFYEPDAPERIRPLSSSQQPTPARWRRRFRVYTGLTALSVVFPIVLIYAVNFDSTNKAFMRELFPGRVVPYMTLLNLAVLALWLGIYVWVFLGILRPHRVGDRDLAVELALLKSEARRGKPRLAFYAGVVMALVFMLVLLAMKTW